MSPSSKLVSSLLMNPTDSPQAVKNKDTRMIGSPLANSTWKDMISPSSKAKVSYIMSPKPIDSIFSARETSKPIDISKFLKSPDQSQFTSPKASKALRKPTTTHVSPRIGRKPLLFENLIKQSTSGEEIAVNQHQTMMTPERFSNQDKFMPYQSEMSSKKPSFSLLTQTVENMRNNDNYYIRSNEEYMALGVSPSSNYQAFPHLRQGKEGGMANRQGLVEICQSMTSRIQKLNEGLCSSPRHDIEASNSVSGTSEWSNK
jgi:hypothetical protein